LIQIEVVISGLSNIYTHYITTYEEYQRDKTFVTVEIYHNRTSTWEVVCTDASWETRFRWLKGSGRQSNVTVEWHIPLQAAAGSYRIRHLGHAKQLQGSRPVVTPYEGVSAVFAVTPSYYHQ
ncbi:neutral ceramidase-like, partial [Myripristis murdjan]|uniref:neutral ceramidase-like n=1 Tax=Myripristis murdjan TaxID=586833 RepID=UPI001175D055